MNSNSIPPNRSRAPLWIIAVALATIAVCLVALVLRLFIPAEPALVPEIAPHAPTAVNPPEREANTVGRRGGIVVRSHSERPGVTVRPEIIPLETKTDAPETVLVENRFFSGAPQLQSDLTPAPVEAANPNGHIVGHVRLLGSPPPEKPIDTSHDPLCARAPGRPLTTQFFVVGTNGELADVLVYIKAGAAPGASALRPTTNLVQFAGCQITPYVSAQALGQKLTIQNTDAGLHNARVDLGTNRMANFALFKGTVIPGISFRETGLFKRISCDVHPWEYAYVSVMPNPFFAVTDREGQFAITNVPPGDYVIEAIHRKAHGTNGLTQNLKLAAGETATVDFEIRLTDKPPTPGR